MTSKVRRYIEFAIQVAQKKTPPGQRYRLGCVIVRDGVPVGVGYNDPFRTHPRATLGYRWPSVHAELAALIGVSERELQGAIAYVVRLRRITRTGYARPCEGCQYHLRQMRVKRVYYTTNTEAIECMEL